MSNNTKQQWMWNDIIFIKNCQRSLVDNLINLGILELGSLGRKKRTELLWLTYSCKEKILFKMHKIKHCKPKAIKFKGSLLILFWK